MAFFRCSSCSKARGEYKEGKRRGERRVILIEKKIFFLLTFQDFPVMPVEHTGFTLKPDGFFKGNPSIDLPPTTNGASKCCT